MNRQERINHYIKRLSEKNFVIYDVRRELEQQNVEENEIKQIVSAVDTELQARLLKTSNRDHSGVFIRIGIVLISVGVTLWFATFVGLLNLGDFFIFVYGSFIGGLSVLLVGLFKKKEATSKSAEQNLHDAEKKRVSFRKNLRNK
ncbi:MAG TPA: hypothetical protein VEW65_09490 [Chryseolinea sp.]|nr:hypothetical protein [Chryseolinea sp.]